ncbi:MAG: ABC transporter substrate-binding protein [Rubrivivax sp.]|nr:ABC transporter substrate-binding protein [Rubrivivax sp.]
MNRRPLLAAGAAALLGAALRPAHAQTPPVVLRVFVGGNNRIDVIRRLLDRYEQQRPGVRVTIESGGATSDLQRRYLATVLSARDPSLDVMQIDIVNPAQFAKAQWIEPLEPLLGTDAATLLQPYLPGHGRANLVDGRVVSLPAYVDAQMLYYRRDLLERHGAAVPRTWDELAAAARKVLDAERSPALKGLSVQGAPIDGTVCTFLTPYWSQGKSLLDAQGRLAIDKPAAERGMAMWLRLMEQGVLQRNTGEVKTQDTTNDFRAGNTIFAVSWGLAWSRYQEADSPVRNKVAIAPLPAMPGGQPATCAGGWQWAVSAHSRHKRAAADLVRWLAGTEAAKVLAIEASMLPAWPALYEDPDVLRAMPWVAAALPVLQSAQARPVSARYGEISDIVRTTTSAMLSRSQPVAMGVGNIESRLRRVLRHP